MKTILLALVAFPAVGLADLDINAVSTSVGNTVNYWNRKIAESLAQEKAARERSTSSGSSYDASNRTVAQGRSGLSIDAYCRLSNERDAAIRQGQWKRACQYSVQLRQGDNVAGAIPVNVANEMVICMLCYWNYFRENGPEEGNTQQGTVAEICRVLQVVAEMCDTKIRSGCGIRIETFAEFLQRGKLDRVRFTANDLLSPIGIRNYLMELPYAAAHAKNRELMARYDALIGQISAETDVYRKNGEYQATIAKFYAKQEYENKYHRTFDPSDRPSADSGRRDDWDSCKRIYDIFGRQ